MRRRADLVPLNAGWEICVGWTPISCAGNAKIWVVLPIGANLRQKFFVGHNPSSDGDRQALTGISNFPQADFEEMNPSFPRSRFLPNQSIVLVATRLINTLSRGSR